MAIKKYSVRCIYCGRDQDYIDTINLQITAVLGKLKQKRDNLRRRIKRGNEFDEDIKESAFELDQINKTIEFLHHQLKVLEKSIFLESGISRLTLSIIIQETGILDEIKRDEIIKKYFYEQENIDEGLDIYKMCLRCKTFIDKLIETMDKNIGNIIRNKHRDAILSRSINHPLYHFFIMSNNFDQYLEYSSLEELEAVLLSCPRLRDATIDESDFAVSIMSKRFELLEKQFEPSLENILKVVNVSNKFLKAWEDGFIKAKSMIEALYEKEQNKPSFKGKYKAEIKLYPLVLYKNSNTGEWEEQDDIYSIMMDYFDPVDGLCMYLAYDPVTKDESNFWQNIRVSKETNWVNEYDMLKYFEDHYICYAIHELYDHNHWALQDIIKINNIEITVKILHRDTIGRF